MGIAIANANGVVIREVEPRKELDKTVTDQTAPDHPDYEFLRSLPERLGGDTNITTAIAAVVDLDSLDYFNTDMVLGVLGQLQARDRLRIDGKTSRDTALVAALITPDIHPYVLMLMGQSFLAGYHLCHQRVLDLVEGNAAETTKE